MVTTAMAHARGTLPRFHVRRIRRYSPDVLLGFICLAMLSDFVFRGLISAFHPGKTDFTELYTSAWLWRHGQNFYDSTLVTVTASRLTGSGLLIAPVYPPTTLVAIAPLTFLPWGLANFLWLCLGLVGIGATIAALMRLGNFEFSERRTLLLIAAVLSFSPIHQSFHLGNIALLAVPLCFVGMCLAREKRDFIAGILLALAALLKPQLGIWFVLFYVIQQRRRLVVAACLPTLFLVLLALSGPVPLKDLLASYTWNFQYWFGVGRPFGFTAGAFPFHVNTIQILLFQLWPNVIGVKWFAQGCLTLGLGIWAFAVCRCRFWIPESLAVSSLVGLSFISLYHSVADVAILTVALCWILKAEGKWDWPRRLSGCIFLLILLPGHSILMRITPHLSPALVQMWWWRLFIARYFVWLLIAFNGVLLFALSRAALPAASDFLPRGSFPPLVSRNSPSLLPVLGTRSEFQKSATSFLTGE